MRAVRALARRGFIRRMRRYPKMQTGNSYARLMMDDIAVPSSGPKPPQACALACNVEIERLNRPHEEDDGQRGSPLFRHHGCPLDSPSIQYWVRSGIRQRTPPFGSGTSPQ
jgi:hypothetical protein